MAARTLRLALVLLLLLAAAPAAALAQDAPPDRAAWPTAGWSTAAPEARGMDPALLAEADARVRAELPYLTSLLVVRGDLVFERYYGDLEGPDETLQLWSATKSFTDTGVGLAIGEGLLRLDQTVGELIPDRLPAGADPRAATVTVEQLLTMTSGFAWDSTTDYQRAFDEVDLAARTLGLPMVCDPGACFAYNSGNNHLLSVIVQTVTGETLADYLQPRLFDPLGIARPVWRTSATGETLGAVGLELTPRDLAKFGYLYLNGGRWDGEQVVPASWVAAATTAQSSGTDAAGVNLSGGAAYGYGWWVTEAAGSPAFFALGLGDQLVYVVPGLDLVVVATTTNAIPYEIPIGQQQNPFPIVEGLIVPAVVGPVAAAPVAFAAQVATPVPAATPVGGGRLFALPGERVFPEGIAYQPATGDFFVGSSVDGTIYRGNVATGTVEVFLPSRPGLVAIGLALDARGRLYVAGGETGAVAVYDVATGQELAVAANGLAPNTFVNDVAVTAAGDAYLTDSFNPILWRLPAAAVPGGTGTPAPAPAAPAALEVFVDFTATGFDLVQPGFNANGIVATPDGRYLLLVQSNTGSLYRVDATTGEVIQVDLGGGSLPGGDGMLLDGQTLLVVREGEITPVALGADYATGSVGAGFTDPTFATPTTIARYDGCLLVVNSQFDAIQGQPDLPFTVSAIPLPNAATAGAAASPEAGGAAATPSGAGC